MWSFLGKKIYLLNLTLPNALGRWGVTSRLKLFPSKLKSRWYGPFTVKQVHPYGIVEISKDIEESFKVNGHHLKHYEDGGFEKGNSVL